MRVLSLFSGGGLGDFGLELAGMEIVGQVEIDEYCQKILNLRWPNVPKWKDIREVRGKEVVGRCGSVDLVSGGFPCQPFSVAGRKKGKDDERNMWPEMFRIIREVKPAWVFAENVRGIVKPYLDTVLADLESVGYATLPLLIPDSAVGAPHRRERLWIIANAKGIRGKGRICQSRQGRHEFGTNGEDGQTSDVGNVESDEQRRQRRQRKASGKQSESVRGSSPRSGHEMANAKRNAKRTAFGARIYEGPNEKQDHWNFVRSHSRDGSKAFGRFWETEPGMGRVVDECANRVDRLKVLGNGQVVQVVEWIGKIIMQFSEEENRWIGKDSN